MAEDFTKTIISGKRKTAVSKLRMQAGTGKVFYNGLPIESLGLFRKLALLEPLRIYDRELGEKLKLDFQIRTLGGGKESQIQAARLALSKALVHITGSEVLRKAFIAYDRNMIVPDARRKEAAKPGDSAPRARRQKSYR